MGSNYKESLQYKAKHGVFLQDTDQHISREDLAAARKAILKYKLRDELSYFKRKNRKKSPNQ